MDPEEPRALSMSLDDLIKENRSKDASGRPQHRRGKQARGGGAHSAPYKAVGKRGYDNYVNRGVV